MPRRAGGILPAFLPGAGGAGGGAPAQRGGPDEGAALLCPSLTVSLSGLFSPVLTLGLFRLVPAPESGTGAR